MSDAKQVYEFGTEPWRPAYERRLAEWSRGFNASTCFYVPLLERAEAERDYWYAVANNPESFKARHREAMQTFTALQNRQTTAEKWAELDRIAAERALAARA